MFKLYLSRAQTRAWSSDLPVGDPTGGAAYGERNDPVSAVIGGAELLGGAEILGGADALAGVGSTLGSDVLTAGTFGGAVDAAGAYGLMGDAAAAAGGAAGTGAGVSASQFLQADIANLLAQGIPADQAAQIAGSIGTGTSAAAPVNWLGYLNSPLGAAGVSSASGLLSAYQSSQAARQAAQRLADANITSTQLQAQMYRDQLARQEPFYQAGLNALPAYAQGVMPGGNLVRPFSEADFKVDPGYAFRMSEGMKALERGAAARGGLLSGGTLKGAQRFGQDLASQEYQNAYNRYVGNQATQRNALAGLTGFAPTAAQAMGTAGTTYANQVGALGANTAAAMANADLTGAAARQSAYMGAGGAFANALSPNPLNAYLNKQLGLA